MRHDLLSDALIIIKNAENVGKTSCFVPRSNLVMNVLDVIKKSEYILEFRQHKTTIEVILAGKINKTLSIRPRFAIGYDDFERIEKRYLPAKNIGIIIVSTSKGLMTHLDAKKMKIGGRLLAYVY